jgi:hypothetical protein
VFDAKANLCGALPMFSEATAIFELDDSGSIHAPILEPSKQNARQRTESRKP